MTDKLEQAKKNELEQLAEDIISILCDDINHVRAMKQPLHGEKAIIAKLEDAVKIGRKQCAEEIFKSIYNTAHKGQYSAMWIDKGKFKRLKQKYLTQKGGKEAKRK